MPDALDNIELITGDCRAVLAGMEAGSVQCVVSSPPYWSLRDYGLEPSVWGGNGEACEHEWGDVEHYRGGGQPGEKVRWQHTGCGPSGHPKIISGFCPRCGAWRGALGLEPTPDLYVAHIVEVFRGVKRVLREDGVLWLNLGDSYCNAGSRNQGTGLDGKRRGGMQNTDGSWASAKAAHGDIRHQLGGLGIKHKDLIGIPWRVAMALQADGWYLRAALPWVKRSAMPESAGDRPNSAVEYVFQLTRSPRYFFDMESVRVAQTEGTFKRYGKNPKIPPKRKWSEATEKGGSSKTHMQEHIEAKQGQMNAILPGGRHMRNGDLWFQSIGEPHGMVFLDDEPVGLDVTPAGFSEAHFATFPSRLVEPLIKSGTSERGCCPDCGAPWQRVIDRSEKVEIPHYSDRSGAHRADAPGAVVSETSCFRTHQVAVPRTLGWRPGCKCREEIDTGGQNPDGSWITDSQAPESVPCTVLDPFSGAGTVALVAARLGRRAIGIEAKAEYNAMAEKRIGRALRPATYQDMSSTDAATLFEETNP